MFKGNFQSVNKASVVLLITFLIIPATSDTPGCVTQRIPEEEEKALVEVAKQLFRAKPPLPPPDFSAITERIEDLQTKINIVADELIQNIKVIADNSSMEGESLAVTANQNGMQVLAAVQQYSNASQDLIFKIIEEGTDRLQKLNDSVRLKRENSERLKEVLIKLQNSSLNETSTNLHNVTTESPTSLDTILYLQEEQTADLTNVLKKVEQFKNRFSKTFFSTGEIIELQQSLKEVEDENQLLSDENDDLQRNITAQNRSSPYIYRPSDCWDHFLAGHRTSGVYNIFPPKCGKNSEASVASVQVWCSMGDEDGWWGRQGVGWTVFFNRRKRSKNSLFSDQEDSLTYNTYESAPSNETSTTNISDKMVIIKSNNRTYRINASEEIVNFTKPWKDYAEGFGSLENDFFIGLDALNTITASGRYTLAVLVEEHEGIYLQARYHRFSVSGPADKYRLKVGEYSQLSSLPDILSIHNKKRFSTYDVDNDTSEDFNCARLYGGGWWFGRCFDVHPTGDWKAKDPALRGILIGKWGRSKRKIITPVKSFKMMIRPSGCDSDYP